MLAGPSALGAAWAASRCSRSCISRSSGSASLSLGRPGSLFGGDDVLNRRSADHETVALEGGGPLSQLLVGHQATVRGLEAREHVEGAGVGHPRRHADHVESGPVDLYGHGSGLCVGHPAYAQAGVQLPQGAGKAFEVGSLAAYHAVGVIGRPLGTMKSGSASPDQ